MNDPEVHAVLLDLQSQYVEQSQVNLVHIQCKVLVLFVLASLEHLQVVAVCIVGTVVVPSFDGSVVTSVFTDCEARDSWSQSAELIHRTGASSMASIDGGLNVNVESHILLSFICLTLQI